MKKVEEKNRFGGQIGNFTNDFTPSTEREKAFQKKHLKAFLRGNSLFPFGKHADGKPAFYPVIRIK